MKMNGKRPGEPLIAGSDKRIKGEEQPDDDIEGQLEAEDQEVRQKCVCFSHYIIAHA